MLAVSLRSPSRTIQTNPRRSLRERDVKKRGCRTLLSPQRLYAPPSIAPPTIYVCQCFLFLSAKPSFRKAGSLRRVGGMRFENVSTSLQTYFVSNCARTEAPTIFNGQ